MQGGSETLCYLEDGDAVRDQSTVGGKFTELVACMKII